MIRASSIVCPPGKCSSRVLPMGSSGPRVRSLPGALLAGSRATILSTISGESMLLPSELAYLCRMASRTLSTRSSSLTSTLVAEAPGLFTHIFLNMFGSAAGTYLGLVVVIDGIDGMGGTGGGGVSGSLLESTGVPVLVLAVEGLVLVLPAEDEAPLSRRRDREERDLDRRRSPEEPMSVPLRLRRRGILILSNPIFPIHYNHLYMRQ
jgi:hypothetical protein